MKSSLAKHITANRRKQAPKNSLNGLEMCVVLPFMVQRVHLLRHQRRNLQKSLAEYKRKWKTNERTNSGASGSTRMNPDKTPPLLLPEYTHDQMVQREQLQ